MSEDRCKHNPRTCQAHPDSVFADAVGSNLTRIAAGYKNLHKFLRCRLTSEDLGVADSMWLRDIASAMKSIEAAKALYSQQTNDPSNGTVKNDRTIS